MPIITEARSTWRQLAEADWVESGLADTADDDPAIPLSEALEVLRQAGARHTEAADPDHHAEPRTPRL